MSQPLIVPEWMVVESRRRAEKILADLEEFIAREYPVTDGSQVGDTIVFKYPKEHK